MSSDLKNIVIVGASGGIYAARALEKSLPKTHRVILIERNDYAFYHPAALRAGTLPGEIQSSKFSIRRCSR